MTAPSMRSPLDRATWRLLRDRGGSPRAADIIERHHADVWHAAQADVRAVLAALDPPSYAACGVGAEAIEAALLGRGNKTFLSRGDRQTAAAAAFSAMLAAARDGA